MAHRLLIVDDDDSIRRTLTSHFGEMGFEVKQVPSAEAALNQIAAFEPHVMLTDIQMTGMSGLDLLARVRERMPDVSVIVFTGFTDVQGAIDAVKRGAYDYLSKPLDLDQVEEVVERCLRDRAARSEVVQWTKSPLSRRASDALVSRNAAMVEVFKTIGAVAATRAAVLIQGETGTGKELIARTIHRNSNVKTSPFVGVNCTALPDSLLESELFGHVRGAFTGAVGDRRGRFEMAGDGTIFLDEIGDTSQAFQAKLLRVLQDREFYPVGAEHSLRTEARVIAATNKDLAELVAKGDFREDLYFRLRVVEIRVPPLRERRSDIALLVRHMLSRISAELSRPMLSVSAEAMADLLDREWPGNVRELENVLMRAAVLCRGPAITPRDLAAERAQAAQPGLGEVRVSDGTPAAAALEARSLQDVQRRHVQRVLIDTQGNKTQAARILQVSRPTLHRMIRDFGLYTP